MEQVTAEDRAAVANPIMVNITMMEQVALYANRLSAKEADNMALQTSMNNLQGEIKNLNAEVTSLNMSGQSVGTGAANKDNGIMVPKWEIERQYHHST